MNESLSARHGVTEVDSTSISVRQNLIQNPSGTEQELTVYRVIFHGALCSASASASDSVYVWTLVSCNLLLKQIICLEKHSQRLLLW